MAWPGDADLWGAMLPAVQQEVGALARALIGGNNRVLMACADEVCEAQAKREVAGGDIRFFREPYGDIWLRDTGPITLMENPGPGRRPVGFRFNGWGGKYNLPHDDTVSARLARHAPGGQLVRHDWILEGGAVDFDGEGTVLTTEACLLNPNRNPGLDRPAVEGRLNAAFETERVLWLKRGLLNDHTDGHVDNLARFVGPGRVVCMAPAGADDPNREILEEVSRMLQGMKDARGRNLVVHRVSGPGRVLSQEGEVMAASHVNFLISNGVVVVPVYPKTDPERLALELAPLFPGRQVVCLPAWHLLHGGGAFHCITQQIPRGRPA